MIRARNAGSGYGAMSAQTPKPEMQKSMEKSAGYEAPIRQRDADPRRSDRRQGHWAQPQRQDRAIGCPQCREFKAGFEPLAWRALQQQGL